MKNLVFTKILFIILISINIDVFAKDIIIEGNQFTDDNIVISIIDKIPDSDEKSQSNYILKRLIGSELFKSVEVSYDSNNFFIVIN